MKYALEKNKKGVYSEASVLYINAVMRREGVDSLEAIRIIEAENAEADTQNKCEKKASD